jgi:hypothetical protein
MSSKTSLKKFGERMRTMRLKRFYAVMHVTRVEEWSIEAENIEAARELLSSGVGDQCGIGERIHAEIEQITE